jgi:hypothetical protein
MFGDLDDPFGQGFGREANPLFEQFRLAVGHETVRISEVDDLAGFIPEQLSYSGSRPTYDAARSQLKM